MVNMIKSPRGGVNKRPGIRPAVLTMLAVILLLPFERIGSLCWFHALTGIHCPLCGLTRSVRACMTLRFEEAVHYHPLGIPLTLMMVSVLLIPRRFLHVLRGRIPLWLWMLLIIITWIVREFGGI